MEKTSLNQDIELRSEKVRNIVGQIPPRLLRMGISIISLVVLFVLILAYMIPYHQYKSIPVEIHSELSDSVLTVYGISYISPNEIQNIKIGQKIEFASNFNSAAGCISQISPFVEIDTSTNKSNYKIKIDLPNQIVLSVVSDITLEGKIRISDKSFLKTILKSLW